ncbi:hypothetical protein Tco_0374143 [Tanacetum coccineum]
MLHKLLKDLQIIREELADYINTPNLNYPAFYDDDDEYTIQYREYLENSSNAITPDLPTEEPDNSLSMGDEHLSTIPETESDKLIKSSVQNLVPIPSESEDFSDNESECNVLVCDNFTNFSNPLFDSDDDFSSSDDESFSDEDELLYDNSSPRPPEESNSEIYDATIESFSPSPIPVEDKLLNNDSLSLPESESFHFDHYDVPSSPRPPVKPLDDGIFFDFEPDTGVLTAKVVEDISEHYVLMPKLLPTQPTLCPDIDTLLPFSSENEDKVFNPGILASHLLYHRDFNPSKTISIEDGYHDSEGDILYLESLLSNDIILSLPLEVFLDHDPRSLSDINDLKIMVKDSPDHEDSHARGLVYRPLDLQSFACLYMGI